MAQWDRWCLCSARMQVQSLAQHHGLKDRCCCNCGVGHNWGSALIPGLGLHAPQGRQKRGKIFLKKRRKLAFSSHNNGQKA